MFRLFPTLVLALACATALAQDTGRPADSEASLERIRERIGKLSQTMERNKALQGAHVQFLEAAEKEIAAQGAKLRRLRAEVRGQQKKLAATETEQARAGQLMARHKQALARQVRAAYIIGKQGQTKLLLHQQDAQRLGRVLVYYEYLNRARSERIGAIQQQLRDVTELAQRQREEAEALGALKQEQEQSLAALKSSRAQRASALSQLRQRFKGETEELASLQQQEQNLQQLMTSLRDTLAELPLAAPLAPEAGDKPFPALKGRLQWPLRGKLLATYGQPKAGGRLTWNGWWIDAPEGAAVKAIARGRVAYVGWMHRYGLIAIVEHEGGYFSLYGHSQSVAKTVGEWVAAGEAIALAGASGGHARPGVYFEVRKGTQPLNPKLWLRK